MKVMWCWRCKQDVSMLDEFEFEEISKVYYDCIRSVKKYRQDNGKTLNETPLNDLFEPVRKKYENITGMVNCHHDAIMHHRILIYGSLCEHCGKPFRTSKAKYCAFCGKYRQKNCLLVKT